MQQIVVALSAGELGSSAGDDRGPRRRDLRSHSVRAALAACGDGDPVIVHDAARPLATPELFEQALQELERSGADAVIAAAPVADTIKEVGDDGGTVARTLDRSRAVGGADAAGVPARGAGAELARRLRRGAGAAPPTTRGWSSGPAAVVRVLGQDPGNIKITTPIDLRVAELLLADRLGQARLGGRAAGGSPPTYR